ncbi:cyclic diguanylate phosphodiesterase (EAL) domain protein [Leptospira fainei serovar Hurstbridge str. BUT 6]|uniref:Cyclic diguanylate phosphodiesterase (EAL) domain protein n=1 Tax=Leptospira fainei serovar Hurstbridge str. BUT 6 TaxID=1193011 RepID=S3VIT4_9LEPT|nr:EAL domain-containing response regulator [Leptospira fainei]EPG76380.1 cyclic diguanylate phosphodiesterase (EAL) domain protein [Leptospira fainei serovar Hurstbridge str. BUT 6]
MNNLKAKKLLILDDEEEITKILGEIAEDCGFNVSLTYDAPDFLNKLDDSFDCIILDLMIPGMDGVDVIRALSEKEVDPDVVLISGADRRTLHSAQTLAGEYGLRIHSVMEKPIRIADMRSLLLDLFGKSDRVPRSKKSIVGKSRHSFNSEELYHAVQSDQFVLHYQPKIDLKTGKVEGFESLVRWSHPEYGLLYPDSFLPNMEKEAKILNLMTDKIIDVALAECAKWKSMGKELRMAVNVSPVTLTELDFPERIYSKVKESGISQSNFQMEVTETSFLENIRFTQDILTRLRIRGIGLSIDDFGTGYSSLKQLHRFPFTELKIDKSFVMDSPQDRESLFICQASIDLGHKLGMTVVAEGIETPEVEKLMKDAGCDIGQGYYYSRPIPPERIPELLENFG